MKEVQIVILDKIDIGGFSNQKPPPLGHHNFCKYFDGGMIMIRLIFTIIFFPFIILWELLNGLLKMIGLIDIFGSRK